MFSQIAIVLLFAVALHGREVKVFTYDGDDAEECLCPVVSCPAVAPAPPPRSPVTMPAKDLVTLAGKRYHVQTTGKLNWHAAGRYCHQFGMKLLSLETPAENKAVIDYLKSTNVPNDQKLWWTSGTELGNWGKKYLWQETGYPVSFNNWLPGEPSDYQNKPEHCHFIYSDARYATGWKDGQCENKYYYVCEE